MAGSNLTTVADFANPDIPAVLTWNVVCENFEDYKNVILAVYLTMKVKTLTIEDQEFQYITSRFCSLSNSVLRERIKVLHPSFVDARASPVWAFRLLKMAQTPPTMMTRSAVSTLVAELSDTDINRHLKRMFHEENDSPDNENIHWEYLRRWINRSIDGIIYAHKKCRSGFVFYKMLEHYQSLVTELSIKVDSMLLCLTDRTSVNKFATEVGRYQMNMLKACNDYVTLADKKGIKHAYFSLSEFKEIETLNFANFKTFIQSGVLWFNHIASSKSDNFNALQIKEVSDATALLTPLVKEIRGFQPSSQDLALEKASRLKITVTKLRADFDKFFENPETNSLAKAKMLLSSLVFCRDNCEVLRLEGATYNEDTIGATPETMAELYEVLFKYIADEEQKIKMQENRDRLEASEVLKTAPNITLPPLQTDHDWLNFKAALDKIMKFHSSDIVKCTIIRNALRNRADIRRCQNLNYASIIEYLEGKYNDSSLLPRLVDRLLMLKPARDTYTSYNNLNEFLAIYSQLDLHQGVDRLDNFVREKLVCLLLTENLQTDFLKDQILKEMEWKKESPLHNDDASTTFSCAQGAEFEEKRRAHFVDSMKIYSEIIRRIVATNQDHPRNSRRSSSGVNALSHQQVCPVCDSSHYGKYGNIVKSLAACPEFRAMPVHEREIIVERLKYCKKCMVCPANGNHDCLKWCKYCKQTDHHYLLHTPDDEEQFSGYNDPDAEIPQEDNNDTDHSDECAESDDDQAAESEYDQTAESDNDQATESDHDQAADSDEESDNNEEDDMQSEDDTVQSHFINLSTSIEEAWVQPNHPHGLQRARMYFSACSNVSVALPRRQLEVLGLLDSGSGPSMCLKSTAIKLQLAQIGEWKGCIETIHSKNTEKYPVYQIPIKDVAGIIHNIAVIGIDNIGWKTPVPIELFTRICKALDVNPSHVQNTAGPIQLILGLQSIQLLAHPVKHTLSDEFPEVALFESMVSPSKMIVGAVGPAMTNEGQVEILTDGHTDSSPENVFQDAEFKG